MEGKKTGMVSMARKNRVCTYYTLLLGLHYVYYRLLTTLALLLGILCLSLVCRAWCWRGHLVKHGYLLLHLFHALLMLHI
ncbi:hypothetical protein PEC301645_31980 [Pectobacterium carotovorum subsp. carotovorum]|nr:hypothetical protein PEC301645_31980 [Pectobacterium carotovorum subsp. carotovorum]